MKRSHKFVVFFGVLLLFHLAFYFALKYLFYHISDRDWRNATINFLSTSAVLWCYMFFSAASMSRYASIRKIKNQLWLQTMLWGFAVVLLNYIQFFFDYRSILLYEMFKYGYHMAASYALARFVTECCFCRETGEDII